MLISTAVTLLIMAGALLSLIYLLIYLFIFLRRGLTGSTKDSDETLFLSLSENTLLTARLRAFIRTNNLMAVCR